MSKYNKYTVQFSNLSAEDIRALEHLLDVEAQVSIVPTSDDPEDAIGLPLPWDAGFGVEEVRVREKSDEVRTLLVLSGGAGPSGWGQVTVKVPLAEAKGYTLKIETFRGEEDSVIPENLRGKFTHSN